MSTYTFYPADNSETVQNVTVAGTPDEFGCIETTEGVYVSTPKIKIEFVSLEPTPGPYTDIFGEFHSA